MQWVRRIGKAGRTVYHAGRAVGRAGKAVHRVGKRLAPKPDPKPAPREDEDLSLDPWSEESLARLRHRVSRTPPTREAPAPPVEARRPVEEHRLVEEEIPAPIEEPTEEDVQEAVEEAVFEPPPAAQRPDPAAPPPRRAAWSEEVLAERLQELVRTSRLDPEFRERLEAIRSERLRFRVRPTSAGPTRAFDASPSLRDGTTLIGVLEPGAIGVAVRIPRAPEIEEGALPASLAIEGRFVAWDPLYDRAIFEGVTVDPMA